MIRIYLSKLLRWPWILGAVVIICIVAVAGFQLFLPRTLLVAEPGATSVLPTEAGLSINGLNSKSSAQINSIFADIEQLGFTWVRIDIQWDQVQPNNSQQYIWSPYDNIVLAAQNHHLKVLGILDYSPSWAAQVGCTNRNACAPKDPTQFAIFASEAAQRYKQSVKDWEIWNEENVSRFWSPEPNSEQYEQMLVQSYAAIKSVNPSASVIVGGLSAGSNDPGKSISAVIFLQQLYQLGIIGSFDAVGYHPYTYPGTPFDGDNAWADISTVHGSLRTVMQAHGDGGKQIWITEYGAPTDGPDGSGFVSADQQAQLARDAFSAIQDKPWIGPFFWYTYQDAGTSTNTKENFFGLKTADGTPKPAYYAWQQLLAK